MKKLIFISILIGVLACPLINAQQSISKPTVKKLNIKDLKILKTDLTIVELKVEEKDGNPIAAGNEVWVSAKWKRKGDQPPKVFRLAFFIDGSPLGSAQGSTVDHTLTSTTLKMPWVATAGTHSIKAVVDVTKVVRETNELNNWKTTRVTIPGRDIMPDLIVTKVEVLPPEGKTRIIAGMWSTMKCYWKKVGSGPTGTDWLLRFYDNGNPTSAGGEGATSLTQTTGWFSQTRKFTVGAHRVTCSVDDSKIVAEANELNNKKTISINATPELIPLPVKSK